MKEEIERAYRNGAIYPRGRYPVPAIPTMILREGCCISVFEWRHGVFGPNWYEMRIWWA